MAIATTTALAIGGLAISAGSAGLSFAQAAKQNKLKTEAERAAADAMAEARKRLDVNVYDKLAIQKEPYELQREALLSTGAQAIQAGAESERGAAATAGRVAMASDEAQGAVRTAMGKELSDLEKTSAAEKGRLLDVGTQMNLEEVAGAQSAAAQAQTAAAQATAQGIQSASSALQQGLQMVPLYEKTAAVRQADKLQREAMGDKKGQLGMNQTDMQKSIASMGKINNVDLSKVGGMTPNEYDAFIGGLDAGTLRQIRRNLPDFASSFNPNVPAPLKAGGIVNPFAIYQ
jgi:hypothetical protein